MKYMGESHYDVFLATSDSVSYLARRSSDIVRYEHLSGDNSIVQGQTVPQILGWHNFSSKRAKRNYL